MKASVTGTNNSNKTKNNVPKVPPTTDTAVSATVETR